MVLLKRVTSHGVTGKTSNSQKYWREIFEKTSNSQKYWYGIFAKTSNRLKTRRGKQVQSTLVIADRHLVSIIPKVNNNNNNNTLYWVMTLWKIFAVDTQFKQLQKRSLKKKFRLQRDSNPWPLRYRCSALPTQLWSHNCWLIKTVATKIDLLPTVMAS